MEQRDNDYKVKVLRTAIICAWIILIACLIFKLLGSKVFNIAVTNQRFIDICNWLDGKGIWCRYILQIVMYFSSTTILILAGSMKKSVSILWFIIIELTLAVVWVIKYFNSIAGFVIECAVLIILPSVISKKWWYGFVTLALDLIFQVLSLFIRGQDMKIFDSNTILSLVMTIDYYIMIALFYMYAIVISNRISKKEVK